MKRLFWATVGGCLLALILSACQSQSSIVVGWIPVEPNVEISKRIVTALQSEFQVSTRPMEGIDQLAAALQSGEVDIAIVEQGSHTIDGINVLLSLYPSVLHVMVRQSLLPTALSPKRPPEVLTLGSVYAGEVGSAGHTLLLKLSDAGVLPPRERLNLLESAFEGDPDIYVTFGGLLSKDAMARLDGYKLLSLGSVDTLGKGTWAEGIALRFSSLKPFIIPQGLYPSLSSSPVLSLSVESVLVTRESLGHRIAYQITKLISQNASQIQAIYPLAHGSMAMAAASNDSNLPIHQGSQRYFDREAPGMLERYAEVLALLVTLLIALTSLSVAAVRIRRQARKDRIDVYFDELLDLRNLFNSKEIDQQTADKQLRDLQEKVTRLVVAERISADSSYVSFISLSNQILAEIAGS